MEISRRRIRVDLHLQECLMHVRRGAQTYREPRTNGELRLETGKRMQSI